MSEYSDKELLDLFHNGSNPDYAFNLLVRKYQRKLYALIRRIVVDHDDTHDVLQNTFVKVWKGLPSFREDAQLYTWLYRIATNESLSFLKKSKRNLTQSIEEYFNHPTVNAQDKPEPDAAEIQKQLQLAIQSLPEKQRVVFMLKYYDEMKYEEMSAVLDTSVGALKASFHIAVKKIEEFLCSGALNHLKKQ